MPDPAQVPAHDLTLYFRIFNEIAILNQLSATQLQAHLPKGMVPSHFAVISHLTRVADGTTPLDLARAFQVPKTTMTHTLSGLEKHGLIAMRPNPDDKRSKQVWLQPEGRAFFAATVAALGDAMSTIATGLPPDQAIKMLDQLQQLRVWMDKNRKGSGRSKA